ncbi:MAG: hypothetical protein FWD25_00835 [Clostridia bacterium]|nr:hypothetical protein [Clostridia bacterium]
MQGIKKHVGHLGRFLPTVYAAIFFLLAVCGLLVLESKAGSYGYLSLSNAALLFALLACGALNVSVRQVMFSPKHTLSAALAALALTVTSSFDKIPEEMKGLPFAFSETAALPGFLLVFVAVFFLCKGLFAFFSVVAAPQASTPDLMLREDGGRRAFWLSFLFCSVALISLWLCVSYPYKSSPDTRNQLQQVHGYLRLLDLHAPTHTLLIMSLFYVVEDYWFVVAVQIVLLSIACGFFGRYLCGRRSGLLLPYGWACALFQLATVAMIYSSPWKDMPYTLCIAALTYLFMRLPDEDWPLTTPRAVAFGLAAAFAFLFRFNGAVVLVASAVFLTVYAARRRYWKQLAAFALSALVAVGGMQGIIYGLFGFERSINGFAVQTFIFGIATVVMEDGQITEEELEEVDELLGLYWIEEKYDRSAPSNLLWSKEEWEDDLDGFFDDPNHEPYNNLMIVSAGKQPQKVIGLYLRLLPCNLGPLTDAFLRGTKFIWAFEGVFGHIFLLVALGTAMVFYWPRKTFTRRWVAFLPVAANMVSIAASTITNELRYLLPTYTLFVPLLFYVLATRER